MGHGVEPDGPSRIWDLETGQPVLSWKEPADIYVDQMMLENAAAIISFRRLDDERPPTLLDLWTDRRYEIPIGAATDREARLTADGRYLVFHSLEPESFATCWWDRIDRRTVRTFPRLYLVDMAADGRWLTVERLGDGRQTIVSVRPPAKEEVITQITLEEPFDSAFFSSDGGYLIVRVESGVKIVELPSGRVCVSGLEGGRFFVLPAQKHVVAEVNSDDGLRLTRWDLTSGREIGRRRLPPVFESESMFLRPTGHRALYRSDSEGVFQAIRNGLQQVPVLAKLFRPDIACYTIEDHETDREVGWLTLRSSYFVELSPDGRTVVCANLDGEIEFWDVPAKKPLGWFAFTAGVLALPFAWLARRRVRRLRREAA
jgi:hypothetical protein